MNDRSISTNVEALPCQGTQDPGLGLAQDVSLRLFRVQQPLRDYGVGAQILKSMGVARVRLLTNNPRKISALQRFGLNVTGRESLHVGRNVHNAGYLDTKRDKLGHLAS